MDINLQAKETIHQLLLSPICEVVNLTNKAVELKIELIQGKITESEFEELFLDLQSLKNINQESMEIERWHEIVEAVNILNIIRQWLPLL